MSVFLRRFTSVNPGDSVLLNIESVNIIDLDPPAAIIGVGQGTALLIAEFEDGPFITTQEVAGASDFSSTWGGVGFTYAGVVGNNPCAVSRNADGAVGAEFWNGNGAVQLNAKTFARLLLCRADTSTGAVAFSPLAFVTGAASFSYTLANSQVLSLDVGAGYVSATFTGTAAVLTSSVETYTSIAPGDTVTFSVDGASNFTATFLAGDTTRTAVIARINQYAGFTFASAGASTHIAYTGRQLGNQGKVTVVGASSGGVLTNLGITAGTTFGTGNCANLAAVTPAEIKAVTEAAITGTLCEVDSAGALRVSNTSSTAGAAIFVGPATTATALGFVAGQYGSVLGVAEVINSGAPSYAMSAAETLTLGIDKLTNQVVTFAGTETTAALVAATINTAIGKTVAASDGTLLRLFGLAPGGQVRVVGASSNTVLSTKLGLAVGTTVGAGLAQGNVIPAGTVVQATVAGGGAKYVTMQTVKIGPQGVSIGGTTVATAGPYSVKVRPAADDGSGAASIAGVVTVIPSAIATASFSASNPLPVGGALTESAIDAAYVAAMAATADINTVAKQANFMWSARQSNVVRRTLRTTAINASASGCFGRVAIVRTPMGTTKQLAQSSLAEPGVGAYRSQRVVFCYPQVRTFVTTIGTRGTDGGTGFTADGNVDVGADGFLASVMSQLPPEENPGQETPFTGGVVALESSANAAGFQMQDYIAFKAAGICAPRFDDGALIFQSGVTSVDPNVNPGLVRIARRRMADYIQDSLALAAKAFGKKLSSLQRRAALLGESHAFLDGLLSTNNPGAQRIAGFTITNKNNTDTQLGEGLYYVTYRVRTLASLDSIVFEATIGDQVTFAEQ